MLSKVQILLLSACLWAGVESATFTFNPQSRALSLADESPPCTKKGLMCETCDTVAECIDIGEKDFLKEIVYKCEAGLNCLDSLGNCTNRPNAKCDTSISQYSFKCRQPGVFPHPFNKCKFFLCVTKSASDATIEAEGRLLSCPEGYSYDPYTTLCNVKMNATEECGVVIPPCPAAAKRGAIPNHPSMYFICLTAAADPQGGAGKIVPNLYICPKDQTYNNATLACEAPTATPGLNDKGRCLSRGLFATNTTCFGYNDCGGVDYVPSARTCSFNQYFDAKTSKCVNFSCAQAKLRA